MTETTSTGAGDNKLALNTKEEGNAAFKKQKFGTASEIYSRAVNEQKRMKTVDAALFTNRAACYLHLHKFEEALADCEHVLRASTAKVAPREEKGKTSENANCNDATVCHGEGEQSKPEDGAESESSRAEKLVPQHPNEADVGKHSNAAGEHPKLTNLTTSIHAKALFRKIEALQGLKRHTDAFLASEQALREAPGYKDLERQHEGLCLSLEGICRSMNEWYHREKGLLAETDGFWKEVEGTGWVKERRVACNSLGFVLAHLCAVAGKKLTLFGQKVVGVFREAGRIMMAEDYAKFNPVQVEGYDDYEEFWITNFLTGERSSWVGAAHFWLRVVLEGGSQFMVDLTIIQFNVKGLFDQLDNVSPPAEQMPFFCVELHQIEIAKQRPDNTIANYVFHHIPRTALTVKVLESVEVGGVNPEWHIQVRHHVQAWPCNKATSVICLLQSVCQRLGLEFPSALRRMEKLEMTLMETSDADFGKVVWKTCAQLRKNPIPQCLGISPFHPGACSTPAAEAMVMRVCKSCGIGVEDVALN
eukprot:TRINITY_DN54367_c0_g1_i1.p1 TRINITY_DN54367_c0_g1~~TRINITY_DN54367_c0_g1_i1.p1  ORF type:complete len:532 (+),score=65.35 TRINITY_DN54367_c0_g1_i1:79-1674(+)